MILKPFDADNDLQYITVELDAASTFMTWDEKELTLIIEENSFAEYPSTFFMLIQMWDQVGNSAKYPLVLEVLCPPEDETPEDFQYAECIFDNPFDIEEEETTIDISIEIGIQINAKITIVTDEDAGLALE